MQAKVRRITHYRCPLARAFQAPMLADVTRIHTGFGPMPPVTGISEDTGWGRVGSSKKVHMPRTLVFPGGYASLDRVLERVENVRWKIEVSDFQLWMLGFTRLVGEWETRELRPGEIEITYTYTLHGEGLWLAPAQWLFAKTFWWIYMGRVLENVRRLADGDAPFAHA